MFAKRHFVGSLKSVLVKVNPFMSVQDFIWIRFTLHYNKAYPL